MIKTNGIDHAVYERGRGRRAGGAVATAFPSLLISLAPSIARARRRRFRVLAPDQRRLWPHLPPGRLASYTLPHLTDDLAACSIVQDQTRFSGA